MKSHDAADPFTAGEFALVCGLGGVYQRSTLKMERAMLAITILAAFLVVIAALNLVDFGRID